MRITNINREISQESFHDTTFVRHYDNTVVGDNIEFKHGITLPSRDSRQHGYTKRQPTLRKRAIISWGDDERFVNAELHGFDRRYNWHNVFL